MANIIIYSTAHCPYCAWAKQLLDKKKVSYQEFLIDSDPDKKIEMERLSGRRSVPQIFINNQPIGGFDNLSALDKSGQLDKLLTK